MVHEDRFTETLLASVLSIPSEKTLLRRHLATHFKELLGADIIQKKREAESTLGYIPLTLSLKAKVSIRLKILSVAVVTIVYPEHSTYSHNFELGRGVTHSPNNRNDHQVIPTSYYRW